MTDRDWTDVDADRADVELARGGAGATGTDVDAPRPAIDAVGEGDAAGTAPEASATDGDAARDDVEGTRATPAGDGAAQPATGRESTTAG